MPGADARAAPVLYRIVTTRLQPTRPRDYVTREAVVPCGGQACAPHAVRTGADGALGHAAPWWVALGVVGLDAHVFTFWIFTFRLCLVGMSLPFMLFT